jgi:hypothetical protein
MEYCRHGDMEGLIKKKRRLSAKEATDALI